MLGNSTAEANRQKKLEVILIVEDKKNKLLIMLKPPDVRFLTHVFEVS